MKGEEPTPEGYMATDVGLGQTQQDPTMDHGDNTGEVMGQTWNDEEMGVGVGGQQEPIEVMTALGPMPLPEEVRAQIPGRFVAKPIIEEREIYVAKKEVHERTIVVPHVRYDHKFKEEAKKMTVRTINPKINEIVREVSHEVYKPVIEEKVIHVPQGVKYVEVPVEVPVQYPPRIVPRPQIQLVERIVETIKPVVREEIIEVPQTIVRNVPKIRTVEIPYYVPRYVEKIVEVPYKPNDPMELPPNFARELPGETHATIGAPQMYPQRTTSSLQLGAPLSANMQQAMEEGTQMFSHGMAPHINAREGHIQGIGGGHQYGAPSDGQMPSNMQQMPQGNPFSCMPQGGGFCNANINLQDINGKGGAMMITSPPEVGNVRCVGNKQKPVILTRHGLLPYQGFRQAGSSQMLFPPLAPNNRVPMNPQDGSPLPPKNMHNHGISEVPRTPPEEFSCGMDCSAAPRRPQGSGDTLFLP